MILQLTYSLKKFATIFNIFQKHFISAKGRTIMKSSIKILTTALLFALVSLFTCNVNAEEKTYNVGTEPTFPPFEMLDSETGKITGFDIDLLTAIGEDQGFKINVLSLSFDGLIPAVLVGKIDMAASGFTITPQRAKVINFSTPYIDAGLGAVKLASDDSIKTLADLKDKTAAVQIGSSGQKAAEDLKAAGKLKEVVVMDNSSLAVTDLLRGRVDIVINDIPVNTAFVKKSHNKLEMIAEPLNTEQYGFVIPKADTELLDKVNQGLQNVRDNGTYDKIYDKYFNTEK